MVMYALAMALLPLAMAGYMMPQPMTDFTMQKNWGWGGSNNNGGQMTGGMQGGQGQQNNGGQMTGGMQGGQGQQNNGGQMTGGMQGGQGQQNNAWWLMQDSEDYKDYMRWCEEKRLAMQEHEQQKALLREFQERTEEQQRGRERERAAKEMESRRESMMAQWRMWKDQLSQSENFDAAIGHLSEMKYALTFKLTMEFLKFCRCSDYTVHLQKYLIHGGQTYHPETEDTFNLDEELQGVDTTNVEAAAQRLAALGQTAQVKAFYGGAITTMCAAVKTYADQVKVWESQYNFMGI